MGGSKWSSEEVKVLIACAKRNYYHVDIVEALKHLAGTERTLTAVRSQLDELRKEKKKLYDRSQGVWIDEEIESYVARLREDESERSDD